MKEARSASRCCGIRQTAPGRTPRRTPEGNTTARLEVTTAVLMKIVFWDVSKAPRQVPGDFNHQC